MILLDSNIIIYSYHQKYISLRKLISENECFVSDISYIETLGYHKLSNPEKTYLHELFKIVKRIPINDSIISIAVDLKQKRKMTLGDSIIAATALHFKLKLATKNIDDFEGYNLELFDPTSDFNL